MPQHTVQVLLLGQRLDTLAVYQCAADQHHGEATAAVLLTLLLLAAGGLSAARDLGLARNTCARNGRMVIEVSTGCGSLLVLLWPETSLLFKSSWYCTMPE